MLGLGCRYLALDYRQAEQLEGSDGELLGSDDEGINLRRSSR
jgi:hypothetical protein